MCGEKNMCLSVRPIRTGSPPRVRGKGLYRFGGRPLPGITPAYAGKSHFQQRLFRPCRDHPRMCGEKHCTSTPIALVSGSPPRMRGKVSAGKILLHDGGITPACAGKRAGRAPKRRSRWDHPRVCGEKLKHPKYTTDKGGSPPRVRGKVEEPEMIDMSMGITPACAGKSSRMNGMRVYTWDHPRVCGEKDKAAEKAQHLRGSPPRVRGKDGAVCKIRFCSGITPACAGKSSIQHLTASLGEFEVQKGHPVPHLRQRLQVWPDHARHLRHGLILHASLSAGQGRRLCPGPCPDTAGSGTPRGPSPAKRPHTSPPAATPGGCRAWQSGATAPGSR